MNYEEAAKWMEMAAQQEHVGAMCGIGICYYYGYGVKRDRAVGRQWVNRAAAMGSEYAQEVLKQIK